MSELGKGLIITGGILIGVGLLIVLSGKIPGLGRLPGDILIRKENFSLYFPVTTCLLVSVILTFVFSLIGKK